MNNVVIASSEADARAAESLEQHHAQLAGTLAVRVEALLTAATRRDQGGAGAARSELVSWAKQELVPHALAEERALYPAARRKTEGRLLVDGMLAEHTVIAVLVEQIASAQDPVRAAADRKSVV